MFQKYFWGLFILTLAQIGSVTLAKQSQVLTGTWEYTKSQCLNDAHPQDAWVTWPQGKAQVNFKSNGNVTQRVGYNGICMAVFRGVYTWTDQKLQINFEDSHFETSQLLGAFCPTRHLKQFFGFLQKPVQVELDNGGRNMRWTPRASPKHHRTAACSSSHQALTLKRVRPRAPSPSTDLWSWPAPAETDRIMP